jgi:FkbM family methyltransferase
VTDIMFNSNGRRNLTTLEKIWLSAGKSFRRMFGTTVNVEDGKYRSAFTCDTKTDAQRAISFRLKEVGTMQWIDEEVREGDIFLDIGANIGIYSIAAGHRVGPSGRVYAFEPHKINVIALLRNITQSGLGGRVLVFSTPLTDKSALLEFNYKSLDSASSGSQFGHARVPGSDKAFKPVATEMALGMSFDDLIAQGSVQPPTMIKIDVDGNELPILSGMKKLLTGATHPRVIQVEINPGEEDKIKDFFAGCGYRLDKVHHTRSGQRQLDGGADPKTVAKNAIFRKG